MATKRRALRRCRSRGVAMVEAVVSVPTLILLFAGLVFGWRLYREKERTTEDARVRVWAYADANCEGDATGDLRTGSLDNGHDQWVDGEGNRADLSGANQAMAGAGPGTHTDILSRTLGTVSLTEPGAVRASALLGGFTSNVSTKRTVMCNEKPYNASFVEMAPAAFQAFASW